MSLNPKPTVLFVCEAGDSSCAYYRALIPVLGLRKLGYAADLCSTILQREDGRWTGVVERDGQPFMIDPAPDVLIVRRLNEPGSNKLIRTDWSACWKTGQRVYVDLDDDPWNVPPTNPAYGTMSREELEGWCEDMEAATGVIASTEALKESVCKYTDAPCVVVRNGIDTSVYHVAAMRPWKDDVVRLGWCGTTNFRGEDLRTIVPALYEALEGLHGQVEFWHLGARPETASVREILGSHFPMQVVERPWVPITQLPQSLAQIDCAVVPMEPSLFNEARSNVTGLALMAAGVPFVSSRQAEYARLLPGIDAVTHDGWVNAVRRLVVDEMWRGRLRTEGLRDVSRHSPLTVAREYERQRIVST